MGVASLVMCPFMYISFSSLFCLRLILTPAIQFNFDSDENYLSHATPLFQKVLNFLMKLIHFPLSIFISSATSSNAASPSFCQALRTFQRSNFLTVHLHSNSSTSSTYCCVTGTTNPNTGCSLVCLSQQEQHTNVYINFRKTLL